MPPSTSISPHEKPLELTDKVYTIFMKLCSMKHKPQQCIDLGQLKILSNTLPSPRTLIIFKLIPFVLQGYPNRITAPQYVHTQHTSISMTSSISISSHLNVINTISSECHQHHLILISSTSQGITFHTYSYKLIHINDIININIISSPCHQLHKQSHSTHIYI